ncbi:acetyl-CoA C-acyltransferase [Spirabiliibacterium falconis]|uniref:acetyl-CoA C-acyltransferase n=1 Tax=Spirabiliibacterium falconis TaxID=572023 RepID=UPI001AAC4A98|nr:acetyl-CoA C-acyltransferase [Spirabiliibacterium falconis]MBE2894313.1 acetyl-CoA C-acyltransferase [Spirabiliibacterium falconis]
MSISQRLVNVRGERIAVVSGLRTPFLRRNTGFKHCFALDLGVMVTNELLNRLPIEREKIDKFIFGQVIQQPDVPNLAREIAITLSMPQVEAYTLTSSCTTGLQAVANVCNGIISGSISCGIAGGADSISNAAISLKPSVTRLLGDTLRAPSFSQKWQVLKRLSWHDFKLQQINLRDPLTHFSLGDISEQMAQNFALSRETLDAYTAQSHQKAELAWQQGWFDDEVMLAYPTPYTHYVRRDNMISEHISPEYYSTFKPIHGSDHHRVTPWSVSEPADGAAAVLLMREEMVEQYALVPLGYIRSFAITGNDVWQNMLLGATYASAKALEWANMTLADIDLIEMHESSAAQVLANLHLFESPQFAQKHLQRDEPLGAVDTTKLNPLGGSLAFGSPRAITSMRTLIQALYHMQRHDLETALVASSGLGGLGAAMVLERE